VLDPNWNVFDRCDEHTKLIHYTNLLSQPWKFPGHPHGELWFQYFRDALASGGLSDEEVTKASTRGYARPTIRQGNNTPAAATNRQVSTSRRGTTRPANWLKRLSRRLRGRAA
jgi:hypothetical protein